MFPKNYYHRCGVPAALIRLFHSSISMSEAMLNKESD